MKFRGRRPSDAARDAWAALRVQAASLPVPVLDDDPELSPLRAIWSQAFAAAQLLDVADPAAGYIEQWQEEICNRIVLAMSGVGGALGTAVGRSARIARSSDNEADDLLARLSAEIDHATQGSRDLAMQEFILAGVAMAELIAKADALPPALRKVEDGRDLSASGAAAKRRIGDSTRAKAVAYMKRHPNATLNRCATAIAGGKDVRALTRTLAPLFPRDDAGKPRYRPPPTEENQADQT